MSTTSRDATPPKGRTKKIPVTISTKTASPQRPKNIITYDFQYPTIIIAIIAAAATTTTAIRHGPLFVRREQVGLHIHTQPYTYTPDFSRQRKELSRSREKSEGFTKTPPLLKDSTSIS